LWEEEEEEEEEINVRVVNEDAQSPMWLESTLKRDEGGSMQANSVFN
jgi:hypothetical protein